MELSLNLLPLMHLQQPLRTGLDKSMPSVSRLDKGFRSAAALSFPARMD
jgi:hypothetical protein